MKKFEPKDLLNIELMKRFEKHTEQIFAQKSKEKTPKILDKIKYHDNLESLNRMGTETGKVLEWGVDPDD